MSGPLEAVAEVPEDIPCTTCGYSLRGLKTKGTCPECGTAVGRSLASSSLVHAPEEYLRKLAHGVSLMRWALRAMSVLAVATVASGIFVFSINAVPSSISLLWGALFACPAVFSIGVWRFASPHPRCRYTGEDTRRRRGLRAVSVLAFGSSCALTAWFVALGLSYPWWVRLIAPVAPVSMFAFVGAVVSGTVLLGLHIEWVAWRIPDIDLASSSREQAWWLPIACLLVLPSLGLSLVFTILTLLGTLKRLERRLKGVWSARAAV